MTALRILCKYKELALGRPAIALPLLLPSGRRSERDRIALYDRIAAIKLEAAIAFANNDAAIATFRDPDPSRFVAITSDLDLDPSTVEFGIAKPVGPLDNDHRCSGLQYFVKTNRRDRIDPIVNAPQIDVIDVELLGFVKIDQSKAWASHLIDIKIKGGKDTFRQQRLPCSQIAVEQD